MGTALGFALTQPPLPALLIFTALGSGLALPFLLLVWLPGGARLLPRPGAWMETFKQALGFLLLATVVWLGWVLGLEAGTTALTALLGGLLAVGLGAWLLHRWPEQRALQLLAWLLIVAAGLVVGKLATGAAAELGSPQPLASPTAGGTAASDELTWEPFSPARLLAYRQAGRPVLVDFTAAWCISCQANERLVLQSAGVRRRLASLGVATMKADWTRHDPQITQALAEFGRSGVPFYLLYGRHPQSPPQLLPELLTASIVLHALDSLAN
jgi:thiol:disulfide interchange protein DsbD